MRAVILILVVLNISCSSDNRIKGEDISSGWAHDATLSYEIITEPINGASLLINHNQAYQYQNLYLIIAQKGGEIELRDTLSIQLVDGQGYWKGECNGNKCSASAPFDLRSDTKEVSILQHSRDQILSNISSIDIILN